MIKSFALAVTLAIVPMAAFAQSSQPPVNNPSNTAPSNSAPVPKSGDATVPAGTAPMPGGVTAKHAAGGVLGAPGNAPAPQGGTMPSTAPTGSMPNPAGGGASSTPAKP